MATLNKDVASYLIHHIVLPKKLPQKDDSNASRERALIDTVVQALQQAHNALSTHAAGLVQQVQSVLLSFQNLSLSRNDDGFVAEEQLVTLFHKLSITNTSESIPLEVKAQNSGIIVSKRDGGIVIEMFELSPQNESVMATRGRLIRSFPQYAYKIPVARFLEEGLVETLARAIARMSSQSVPEFQPKVQKAGHYLSETWDTTHPGIVTDYLVSVLAALGIPADVSSISKSTREDILWSQTSMPWRRSPLWLLMRVTMQLTFSRLSDCTTAHSIYKAIIVQVLTKILELATELPDKLESEMLYAITSKLDQRLRKLQCSQREDLCRLVFALSQPVLLKAHRMMKMKWTTIMDKPNTSIDMNRLPMLRPSNDLTLHLSLVDNFRKSIADRQDRPRVSTFSPDSNCPFFPADKIPSALNASQGYELFLLSAIEKWVRDNLSSWLDCNIDEETTCEQLGTLMQGYHRLCNEQYPSSINVPKFASIMYLTLMELWVASDKCACHSYPLLLEYDPEINFDSLQALLLPFRSQLVRLHVIEKYLISRRAKAKLDVPSIFRNFGKPSSFAVRFFDQSPLHQLLRTSIEQDATTKRQEKHRELATLKAEYSKIMAQVDKLPCENHEEIYYPHGRRKRKRVISTEKCPRCTKRHQAENLGLEVHEWPLSEEDSTAKATVFEIKVPENYSHWRDATMFILKDVLSFTQYRTYSATTIYTLHRYDGLAPFRSDISTQRIRLSSATNPMSGTHYRIQRGVALIQNEDVCLNNALNFSYYDSSDKYVTSELQATDIVATRCTYQVPERSSKLQSYLRNPYTSQDVTANTVIASLSDSPAHISMGEFKAFGVLPLGYNIQYLNILAQLAMPTVDLGKAETHCLLLQTIHMAGPASHGAYVERIAHQILLDESFCQILMKEIKNTLDRVKGNWETWRALELCVQLILRVFEITNCDEVRSLCTGHLDTSRQIALHWIKILKQRLRTAIDNVQRVELSSRITNIALVCMSTFDVDDMHLDLILFPPSTVSALLQSSITIQEAHEVISTEDMFLHRNMMHSWMALLYRALATLRNGIVSGTLEAEFHEAVSAAWTSYRPTGSWVLLDEPKHHWAHVKCDFLDVHFNLLTAELLVNGLPLSRLPRSYELHKTYSALFRGISIEVMPSREAGMAYSAKHKHSDYELSFAIDGADLLVLAVKPGQKFDLVPSRLLKNLLPTAFVEYFHHWYDHTTGEVEFRPRLDPWTSSTELWRLKRFNSEWQLVNAHCCLINPSSDTGRTLSQMLAPLEHHNYIHTTLDDCFNVSIELPRLRLSFLWSPEGTRISCRTYPGMIIDSDQMTATLIGLCNKLVLKHECDTEGRSILIPEGSITYQKKLDHVVVSIDPNTATKIRVYSLDSTLSRLIDDGSLQSKLYLCYLHALTSHCLIDPATGHTGTESALKILRSAAVASFDIPGEEEMKLLGRIARLTPGRDYYPKWAKEMQQVHWDAQLPFMSQHPSFYNEVERLFIDSQKKRLLYRTHAQVEPPKLGFAHSVLLHRDMIRSSTFQVDGFGAEAFTRQFDVIYAARSKLSTPERSQRSFIATKMILRDDEALHSPMSVAEVQRCLCKHFGDATVQGPGQSLEPSSFNFAIEWLSQPSCFLPKVWCSFHSALSSTSHRFNKFAVAMWLATIAFSGRADMNVVQALAALYRIPEVRSVSVPPIAQFELSKGCNPSSSIIRAKISARRPIKSCPEQHLECRSGETTYDLVLRKYHEFNANQGKAIADFAHALYIQWPCERPEKPALENANIYIDTKLAMEQLLPSFKSWYNNHRFEEYIWKVAKAMGNQKICEVLLNKSQTIAAPENIEHSGTNRSFTKGDIFDMVPLLSSNGSKEMSTLAWPDIPEDIKEDITLIECSVINQRSRTKDRLTRLCETLDTLAISPCEKQYVLDLRESRSSLQAQPSYYEITKNLTLPQRERLLRSYFAKCLRYFRDVTTLLENVVSSGEDIGPLLGQCPRISPTFWLEQLNLDRYVKLPQGWQTIVIQYGLAVTDLHRARRLLRLSKYDKELAEELRNRGHQNWEPEEEPEILLLEAESGIMVREVQQEIAQQMREPPENRNSAMQLNMGQGKSSVIVPMVAAALADGKRLVRVIVGKPQSKQMLEMLVSKLGGLLNRRIYHLPFTRALSLNAAEANIIGEIFQDCMARRGILLVQPEHLLSFKLMGIECLINEKHELGHSLLRIQEFFDLKSRDIVDESDENFSPKFELVYTIGTQRPIDMTPGRWTIVQAILELVGRYALQVKTEMPSSIEVDDIKSVEESDFWNESAKEALLLVRGLLACGVLRFTIQAKRWRVNYGLDLRRSPRTKLAVPYRSKDNPSLRSEFSHPDVVIVLTSLTYYYGGLSDEDLFDAFAHLMNSDQAVSEYHQWVRTSDQLVDTYRHLGSVNIKDRSQCLHDIFPPLRYSKGAIDYFLSQVVFAKEMREFSHKLSASGWDIAQIKPNPTTGFSGTIDARHMLPLTIHHLDLPNQKHTNALVLDYLLGGGNSAEVLPPCETQDTSDAEHLIAFVNSMEDPTRVILDVGAQILELNNLQVAQTWLKMSNLATTKAVVFFNDEEELCVLDRNDTVEHLQTSPFAKRLIECLIYLDEAHTRGTDLKLPHSYRAAVTLGANLTKDRLVQACMRMRKLGKGQTVVFCIPEEIRNRIVDCRSKPAAHPIEVSDVLIWGIQESLVDLRRSLPLWATQGRRFEDHKDLLHGVHTTKEDANGFLEVEAQTIEQRYRPRPHSSIGRIHRECDVMDDNNSEIVKRCQDFGIKTFNSATLQEEQERELAPEIEEEREVQRLTSMQAEEHSLHKDLVLLVETGQLPYSSRAFVPAFEALNSTSVAKSFDPKQFPTDLLVTTDYIRTVKRPSGLPSKSYISDNYHRPIQWILSVPEQSPRIQGSSTVMKLIVISPFEADQLLVKIKTLSKVTLHLYAARTSLAYQPLDTLDLYSVGRPFDPTSVPRSLIVQLNLFSGQLYFRSYDEYVELCEYLGLASGATIEAQTVQTDGFVVPPMGIWGLQTSPVKFLREMVVKVRRDGEGIGKTHLGKILDGALLERNDFE
ncbi:hypothetical protein N0V90_006577 [Kalmusia sp. IMI 367209]|nr:hypothetical protein N0V90_006577 [Kalmusia sp. IMI 367209]